MKRRRWVIAAGALLATWLLGGVVGAFVLTWPRPVPIPALPELGSVVPEDVAFAAGDGVTVRGSLYRCDPERAVVLVAGIRGNRLHNLERARWYVENGWSALLIDLRGTGSSDVRPISFGWHERHDVLAAGAWLRSNGWRTVGAHGLSLGAAAILYGADAAAWDFAVLEAPYDSIRQALANRLPWVPWPEVSLWPLIAATEWRAGVAAASLRPIEFAPRLHGPTLWVCGDADEKVGVAAAEALFAASGAARKSMVWVVGAAHVDLWPRGRTEFVAALQQLLRPWAR